MNEIEVMLAALDGEMKDEMITDLLIMLSRLSLQQEALILADDAIIKAMQH